MRVSPTIAADIPPDWQWKETYSYIAPDGVANVIASSEPLPEPMDTATYTTVQGELLKQNFPGYRELDLSPSPAFGAADAFVRTFEWTPPESEPVTQVQLYAVIDGRGYTATATAEKQNFSVARGRLFEVLGSLVARPA